MQSPCAKRRRIDSVEHQVHNDEIIQPEMGWNDDTYAFYNDSWSFEMSDMVDEPVQWSELSYPPRRTVKCTMCGNSGHDAASCPESCCLTCGEKTTTYQDACAKCSTWSSAVCEICGYRGHMKSDCQNLWKCYHSTIDTPTMFENPANFEFNWVSVERDGGFGERFMNANSGRVSTNWS